MILTISVEDAERSLDECIRRIEAGDEYVITRDGRPVARLVSAEIGFGPPERPALGQRR